MDNDFEVTLARYERVLGQQLRGLRKGHRWTREQLNAQMWPALSRQTLATYEQATRRCTVKRLVELCEVLGTTAGALLTRVDRRVFGSTDAAVRCHLASIAGTADSTWHHFGVGLLLASLTVRSPRWICPPTR